MQAPAYGSPLWNCFDDFFIFMIALLHLKASGSSTAPRQSVLTCFHLHLDKMQGIRLRTTDLEMNAQITNYG